MEDTARSKVQRGEQNPTMTHTAKMGSIKDRIEAEDIKKRWQEYTEGLYKKIFTTHIITMV